MNKTIKIGQQWKSKWSGAVFTIGSIDDGKICFDTKGIPFCLLNLDNSPVSGLRGWVLLNDHGENINQE